VILDTNALSAFADGDSAVVERIGSAAVVALPVVVLGEFRYGIAHSRNRRRYESWLDQLVRVCAILDITSSTAARYAEIRLSLRRAGTPIPVNDAWIAALCRQHGHPVLSRDRHFDFVDGIRRVTW